jgi:hypothetical protein
MLKSATMTFNPDALSSSCAWISSDFAQAIRLPSFGSYQPGCFFFQSGLHVDLMAIVDDMRLHNYVYLLVEGRVPDFKDANVTWIAWQVTVIHSMTRRLQQAFPISAAHWPPTGGPREPASIS